MCLNLKFLGRLCFLLKFALFTNVFFEHLAFAVSDQNQAPIRVQSSSHLFSYENWNPGINSHAGQWNTQSKSLTLFNEELVNSPEIIQPYLFGKEFTYGLTAGVCHKSILICFNISYDESRASLAGISANNSSVTAVSALEMQLFSAQTQWMMAEKIFFQSLRSRLHIVGRLGYLSTRLNHKVNIPSRNTQIQESFYEDSIAQGLGLNLELSPWEHWNFNFMTDATYASPINSRMRSQYSTINGVGISSANLKKREGQFQNNPWLLLGWSLGFSYFIKE